MRSRCSTRCSTVSTWPYIIVAVVRMPRPWAIRCTSSHSSLRSLRKPMTSRTPSSRISAPAPGIESSPAARSRAYRLLEGEPRNVGDVDDLRRRQAVELHHRIAVADFGEQLLVVAELQPGVEPPLHQDLAGLRLGPAEGDELVDLGEDLLVREHVPLVGPRGAVEGAEVAPDPADVGVVDVAADVVGDDRLGMLLHPDPVRQDAELGEVGVGEQAQGVFAAEALPGEDPAGDVGYRGHANYPAASTVPADGSTTL